jgi:hypothetical protein
LSTILLLLASLQTSQAIGRAFCAQFGALFRHSLEVLDLRLVTTMLAPFAAKPLAGHGPRSRAACDEDDFALDVEEVLDLVDGQVLRVRPCLSSSPSGLDTVPATGRTAAAPVPGRGDRDEAAGQEPGRRCFLR